MGTIVKTNTFTAGAIILASEHNQNFDEIINEINGQLDNTNLKTTAGIVDTKLATISTAGKVNTSAITGTLTAAHIDTGVTANKIFYVDTGDELPACSGANLTSLNVTAVDLGTGTANSTTYLRGDRQWAAAGAGNCAFSYTGSIGSINSRGFYVGDSTQCANTDLTLAYWGRSGNTYGTIINGKFYKTSGMSTLSVHCSIWDSGLGSAVCLVNAGGISGTVIGTTGQHTPEWKTFDVDISSLATDTVHALTVQLQSNGNNVAFLDSIIGFVK